MLGFRDAGPPVDVLVVGGGNAGLCAALSAACQGANVLVLERSSKEWRGGNSKYTRNVRVVSHDSDPALRYTEEEFFTDLLSVSGDIPHPHIATLVIASSEELPSWMEKQGVRWQAPMRGTLQLDRTNRFFLGGGKALLNRYYSRAESGGVAVHYGARVHELEVTDGRFVSAVLGTADGIFRQRASSVIIASGGLESNLEWLGKVWGPASENFIIRGTRWNDGRVLLQLLELGAEAVGGEGDLHAVAVDARSPRFDGGIVTRVDAIPLGIVVNGEGQRFYDEGEDAWPKRYAIWGRLIAQQPGQIAYAILDSSMLGDFIPPLYAPITADSIESLAAALSINEGVLRQTILDYNDAAAQGRTWKLVPPKTRWAAPLETLPYCAYPLRPGVTFTYRGVRVNEEARVVHYRDGPFDNIYAAGEVMAGNVLSNGYLAGIGMTIGSVLGRIAGKAAASHARC